MSRLRRALAVALAVACTALIANPASADSIRDREWYLAFLDIPEAHQIGEGEGIIVAVVDTGVNSKQAELSGNLLPGYDNIFGLNGWIDDDGHGTAMASLIAAHGVNGVDGTLGIAPRAKILPIKVSESGEDGDYTDYIRGIDWAVEHGAKVINISLAGKTSGGEGAAIRKAIAADVVIVAAAGNRPEDTKVGWPAAYPGVIAAAGVDRNGNHAEISVTGPEVVLSAPAVDITAPHADGQYLTASGTSDASAIIAGVAALVRSKYPTMSAAEVVHRLTATAIDKGPPGRDDQYGYGIVSPVAALTADVPPLPTSPTASPTRAQPTGSHPADTAAPARKAPTTLIGILIALLVGAAAVGVVIARTRTRR